MAEDDTWNTVNVSNTKEEVEYEIEEEVEEPEVEEEVQASEEEAPSKEKASPELEGIETQGAQKRIRQLVRQRKDRDDQITALIQQNEVLAHQLNSKDTEVQEINKLTLDASEKQLTDKMELARAVYLEAFEGGDNQKVLKAQEMLNEAQADLKAVATAKLSIPEDVAPVVRQPAPPRNIPSPDPGAEDWASKNEWFGHDKIMTAAALAIDAELKEEGYNPSDKDFYQEIDNRIKTAFPHKFGEVQERVQENEVPVTSPTSKPAQVVSGGSRSSPSSKNKIKLSQEDLRLAQKWNIPLETYAAEKLKIDQAGGEYTDVYNK